MRIIPEGRRNHPERQGERVNGAAILDTARGLAVGLVEREQARGGGPREAAWARVASRLGTTAARIEALVRERAKAVEASLFYALAKVTADEARREIGRLECELERVGRLLGPLDHEHLREVEAAVRAAREGLERLDKARRI